MSTNSIVLADNGFGTIASGLAVGDTALAFTAGHGARFPAVASGQVLHCCLLNTQNVIEEVIITAHAAGSDSATMARAQGSTTAKAWTAGDRIEARVSSTALKRLQREVMPQVAISTADGGTTYTGASAVTALGYVTGTTYQLSAATTNNSTTPTINLDGLGAVTVVMDGGGLPYLGQMPVNGLYLFDGSNFILLNGGVRCAVVAGVRALDAASGDVAYTGTGFRPKSISFTATLNGTRMATITGFTSPTGAAGCIYDVAAVPGAYGSVAFCMFIDEATGSKSQGALLKSMDANGFTLTWTRTGVTSAGNIDFYANCVG